jgi:hypothetical protein
MGMETSRTRTSGSSCAAAATADCPSLTVAITSKPLTDKNWVTYSSICLLSSANNTRILAKRVLRPYEQVKHAAFDKVSCYEGRLLGDSPPAMGTWTYLDGILPCLKENVNSDWIRERNNREEALSAGQLRWRKIFDQQNFVSPLTIYKLVNEVSSDQDAVAPGAQSLRFAEKKVTNRIICRIVDSCMVYFFQRETPAWILNPAQDHLSRAHISNFDVLAGIEITSVLDGVEQHFAEGD